ncbi:methyltransferase domain-containing protein [Nocardia sp. NBC_01503]|uniref:putative RNA methyltransferase n=1 Tax=Nocardia sp. NBC_01503 TaxID=2975997 RepID=UPI002E7B0197|nr:methyltransferase domain-containing protein [Nocardia sp. NBC_01503]WTL35838.1 methyltransferase domain-containing protein [Nocardia sp. NBC_01503]
MIACVDLLSCPECGRDLAARDRSLCCPRGHSFDIAKQGYVSLLTGASTKMTGDTPAMLDARAAFQQAGHFQPIADALARAIGAGLVDTAAAHAATTATPSARKATASPRNPALSDSTAQRGGMTRPGTTVARASAARLTTALLPERQAVPEFAGPALLEIGAGTGYYLAAALDAVPSARGLALDVSKPAVRRSARAHSRAGAVLADAWRGLPMRDGSVTAALSVFAPRNAREVARVLNPAGRFLVVTPTARHLGELIEPLDMVSVDARKTDRLADSLEDRFELLDRSTIEFEMPLTQIDIANVSAMGPSAFHAAEQRAERIAALPDPFGVTASVTVSVYRPRG